MAKILCVDDEAFILEIIKEILHGEYEHEVEVRENGQTGLEAVKSDQWDLIICDMQMPGMTGIQFAHEVRNGSSSNKDVPILFVSAFSDPAKNVAQGLTNVHFMDKPIIIPILVEAVEKALKS